MSQSILNSDFLVNGQLSCKTFGAPSSCIADAQVVPNAGAGTGVQASKLQHQHQKEYSQPGASNAVVERKVVHVLRGATGLVVDFNVGARVAATGNATATIDLQKNGTSILSTTITLDNGTAAYILKAGTLAAAAQSLVVGDVIEVVISAVNAGTGALAQGLFAEVNIREDAQ